MIPSIEFKNAVKLTSLGVVLNTNFYYSKRKKTRHASDNIPRGIRDFNKIYVPAPAESELKDWLFARLKESKGVLAVTVVKDKAGFTVVYKGTQNDKEFYSCSASNEADAIFQLIIKLIKHGKIKI